MINKYVGETEKKFKKCLGGAENNNAVLLFDESDGLIGEQTEIKDAYDRYDETGIDHRRKRRPKKCGSTPFSTDFPKITEMTVR